VFNYFLVKGANLKPGEIKHRRRMLLREVAQDDLKLLARKYRRQLRRNRGSEDKSVGFDDIEWTPEGGNVYSYYLGDDFLSCAKPRCDKCKRAKVEPRAEERKYTFYAVGNLDWDSACDVWSINDKGDLENIVDDTEKRW